MTGTLLFRDFIVYIPSSDRSPSARCCSNPTTLLLYTSLSLASLWARGSDDSLAHLSLFGFFPQFYLAASLVFFPSDCLDRADLNPSSALTVKPERFCDF